MSVVSSMTGFKLLMMNEQQHAPPRQHNVEYQQRCYQEKHLSLPIQQLTTRKTHYAQQSSRNGRFIQDISYFMLPDQNEPRTTDSNCLLRTRARSALPNDNRAGNMRAYRSLSSRAWACGGQEVHGSSAPRRCASARCAGEPRPQHSSTA